MKDVKKFGSVMIFLGLLSVCSCITSMALTILLLWFRDIATILGPLIGSIATTFMVTVQTFILNRYFERRLKENAI